MTVPVAGRTVVELGARASVLEAVERIAAAPAADDLVLRMPGYANIALANVRERVPGLPKLPAFKFNFPELPKLPALPRFVTKDSIQADARLESLKKAAKPRATDSDDDDDAPLKPPVIFKPGAKTEEIELAYDNDEPTPAAVDAAFVDSSVPGPSVAATIPPLEEQKVPAAPAAEAAAAASGYGNAGI